MANFKLQIKKKLDRGTVINPLLYQTVPNWPSCGCGCNGGRHMGMSRYSITVVAHEEIAEFACIHTTCSG
jgi:hypothetical protein